MKLHDHSHPLLAVETLKKVANHHRLRYVNKSKMDESQLASYDELTWVSGINPLPSSYLAPYTIPNFTRLTILSNTCNLVFYYASTCTIYVDPLQARPTKCCERRCRYGKTYSFYMYSYHRARSTYYLVLRYVGIDYCNSSSIQQSVYTWHGAQSTGRIAAFSALCTVTDLFLCSMCT